MRQVRSLLRHCFQEVPYYRRIMSEAGFADRAVETLDDLRKLPLLTRELYQAHAPDLRAKNLPSGMTPAWSGFTSGTSGVPIRVHKSNHDGLWWNAFFLRDLEWCGLDPRGRLASIRLLTTRSEQLPRALEGGASPFWNRLCQSLLESGPSYAIDIRQDPRRQLQWLREVDPDYLLSLPSNLDYLAGMILEQGIRLPRLRAIQAIGEPLPEEVQQRIETAFGVPVKNLYSTTEGGYMASACPLGHGLHVHAENVLAEVLDDEDRPCAPGRPGRLVFTTLHSYLAPFVRYDIMDDVTAAPGPCPCGRGLPLWTRVDGRRHPLLHLPDSRRTSSMGITLGLRKVGGVHQFQIVQRAPDRILLRVVPDRTWRTETASRMRQVVQMELGAAVGVDVEEKPFLERPAGGKLRVVVNELEERPCR
jgi:phenylacetate-CoA ligase